MDKAEYARIREGALRRIGDRQAIAEDQQGAAPSPADATWLEFSGADPVGDLMRFLNSEAAGNDLPARDGDHSP